jgi:hypothetical protein
VFVSQRGSAQEIDLEPFREVVARAGFAVNLNDQSPPAMTQEQLSPDAIEHCPQSKRPLIVQHWMSAIAVESERQGANGQYFDYSFASASVIENSNCLFDRSTPRMRLVVRGERLSVRLQLARPWCQDEHADAFTVAKAMSLELLQHIRDLVDKRLPTGSRSRISATTSSPSCLLADGGAAQLWRTSSLAEAQRAARLLPSAAGDL